jgi:hypothetical protein
VKHYSLRLTDDDYAYFCAIAAAESLSLSASIRRHMHDGGLKLGLRVHHTMTQGATNVSSIPVTAFKQPPVNAVPTAPKYRPYTWGTPVDEVLDSDDVGKPDSGELDPSDFA